MKTAIVVKDLKEFVERARGEARCHIQVLDLEAPNRATVVLVAEAPCQGNTHFVVYVEKLVLTPMSIKYWVKPQGSFEEDVLEASRRALEKLISDIRRRGLQAGKGKYIYVFKSVV